MNYQEQAKQLGYIRQDIDDLPANFFVSWDWKEVWSNGEHTIILKYRDGMSTFRCSVIKDGSVYYQGNSNNDLWMNSVEDAEAKLLQAMKEA